MSIVFITIPGEQKKAFANELHLKTGNKVSHVIVQKTKHVSWQERFAKLVQTVGWLAVFKELFYILYIRIRVGYRGYLKYFFHWTNEKKYNEFLPQVSYVDDVNSDQVFELLQKIKPKLIVVWGANILKPRIFKSAEHAVNLHMGLGEHYRGAVANHYAILEDKVSSIGAMIHKIDHHTDTGDVYKTIKAELTLSPKEMFTKLNDEAFVELLDISHKLLNDVLIPTTPQNLNRSKNILLRQWTPSRRFIVAQKIKNWERKQSL